MKHIDAMREAYQQAVQGSGGGYVSIIIVQEIYVKLTEQHGVTSYTSVLQLFRRS